VIYLAFAMAAFAGWVVKGLMPSDPRTVTRGTATLVPGSSYRLTYRADGSLEGPDAQADVRFELISHSAFDIAFDGSNVSFTIRAPEPRSLPIGSSLEASGAMTSFGAGLRLVKVSAL
jgi:hypothetical protein